MVSHISLIFCLQACIIQTAFSQNAIGHGPGQIGAGSVPGQIGPNLGPIPGPIGPLTGPGANGPLGVGAFGGMNQLGFSPLANGPLTGPGGPLANPIGPLSGPIGPLSGPIGPVGYGAYGGPNYAGAYGANLGAYGGSGNGGVTVVGELPVAGTTNLMGQVPIMGAVQFAGAVPAAGAVTISGTCACNAPYGY